MTDELDSWFQSDVPATCARHRSVEATSTCARCGCFCCEACITRSWCAPCALLVWSEYLPATAQSVAWKLLLAPVLLTISTALWVQRGNDVPLDWVPWLLPMSCAVLVLRKHSAAAAWIGAGSSLLLLTWRAFTMVGMGAELRLLDLGLLAIAPLLALGGAARLGRIFAQVTVLRSVDAA